MTTRSIVFVAGCLALAVAAGCGSSVTQTTGGTGGAGGTGATGGTGGTGGTGATGGTGGAGVCSTFGDEPGAGSLTLHILNQTPQPIYLPGDCEGQPVYELIPNNAGEDITTYPFDPSCLQTCADLQTEPQYECGACAPAAIRIDPGQTRDVVWNGAGLRGGYQMPAQCWAAGGGAGSCSRIVTAPAGMWSAHATAFNQCTDNCTCQPDGNCFGTASGQMAQADQVTFAFPSATSVDVVFNTCAFGCP
jgi:hypothetical protein